MTRPTTEADGYREQLARWARALAAARVEEVEGALAAGSSRADVLRFAETNRVKRTNKLRSHLGFLIDILDGFDDLLNSYMLAQPLRPCEPPSDDALRFLGWLAANHPLTPEQGDYVACQRAWDEIEAQGRARRRAHVRFQELWSVAGELAKDLDTNTGLHVHLNPLRARSRFATAALLGEEEPPADVLFFAAGNGVGTAILEPAAWELVEQLAARSPCTLAEWGGFGRHADAEYLTALCRDLAEMGLVAFG